jgi:hypothetical protein
MSAAQIRPASPRAGTRAATDARAPPPWIAALSAGISAGSHPAAATLLRIRDEGGPPSLVGRSAWALVGGGRLTSNRG